MKKSAKTGKVVSKEFAEANPDTTYEQKVVKAPKAKAKPDYSSLVGQMCIFGDEWVGFVESLDKVIKYETLNGVITTNEVEVDFDAQPVIADKDRAFVMLNG